MYKSYYIIRENIKVSYVVKNDIIKCLFKYCFSMLITRSRTPSKVIFCMFILLKPSKHLRKNVILIPYRVRVC